MDGGYDRDRRDRDKDRDRNRDKDGDRSRDRDRDRDRERDRKPSRRSRSRSKDREAKRASRSATPPRRRRKRTATGFDQPPPGGVVPAVVTAAPAPVVAAAPVAAPGGFSSMAVQPPSQQATRHARRVYVGGLPPTANEQNIATFFSNALAAVGGTTAGPGSCVVNVYINYEKKFAFVEFRTVEETSNAMALDGIMFEGVSVRVRRPNDYNPAAAAALGPSVPNPNLNLQAIGLNAVGSVTQDASDRIFVGGLPYYLTEEQCRELLSSFGTIKSFDLVKDKETGNSKGYGFVVYNEVGITDVVCAGLNGMRMGDRTLTVRRATEQHNAQAVQAAPAIGSALITPGATRIVVLEQAVTPEELQSDEEYTDILEDMREECGKYGAVQNIHIPRAPKDPAAPVPPGVGKVVIEYGDATHASAAQKAMHGRRFAGRTVVATFLPEDKYQLAQFDG